MTGRGANRKEDVSTKVMVLAAEIAETTDKNVPTLLLRLDEILKSVDAGTNEAAKLRSDIIEYDLLQVLILVLKQDFARVTGSWDTASKLALLLSDCCLDVRDEDENLKASLPDAIDNMLLLARRIQEHYLMAPDSKSTYFSKEDLLTYVKTVLRALKQLVQFHVTLLKYALRSSWLLQLLITDDPQTAIITMGLITQLVRIDEHVLSTVEISCLHTLLDEMVYKLAISSHTDMARTAIKTILLFCELHPPCVEMICLRYKGLRLLATRWSGKGFGRELKTLLMLLEAGSAQRADMLKYHSAAMIIQANWRGYNTRNQLQKADKTFKSFHRSYRIRRDNQVLKKEEELLRSQLEHQLLMARRRAIRQLKERQLKILQILPAGAVAQYMKQEQHDCARRIQAYWRGYRARRGLGARQYDHKINQAAITIQRAALRWIERVRTRRQLSELTEWPLGLTDERREELAAEIRKWREDHPYKHLSRPEQEELHDKAQTMLLGYRVHARQTMRAHQHRRALLAQLDIDCQLLSNVPKLTEVTEADLDKFVSRSVPIATRAHQLHTERMRRLKQPWWMASLGEFNDGHSDDSERKEYVKLA